jgi:hypothetical protein
MKLADVGRIPKGILVGNLLLIGLAVFFAVSLTGHLSGSRSLPAPPGAREVRPGNPGNAVASPSPGTEDRLESYNVIVVKHLFNPARSEGVPAQVVQATPLPPKPFLHGVVLDGDKSRAYLEDPSTKRVLSYRIGDVVAGGQLQAITADHVSIQRSDGQMNVMLMDPTKPKPAPAPAPAQAQSRRDNQQENAPAGARPARAQAAQPDRSQQRGNPLAPLFRSRSQPPPTVPPR